ncbi:MAG: ankyrin repeat domain-containing protein [Phycisphaerales bacterium JB064]
MKRLTLMLCLLLALGLSTSLLIAWAGALVDRSAWPDTPLTGTPTAERTEMRGWLVETGRDRTLTWRTFKALDMWDEPPDLEAPTNLPSWSVGHALPDQPGPFAPARERTSDMAWEVSAGWPMRCVRAKRGLGRAINVLPGRYVQGGVPAIAVDWPLTHGGIDPVDRPAIETWPFLQACAIVPFTPLPLGLAVNTLAYGAAWLLVLLPIAVPAVLRRRWRRSRGRCIRCGHPRDGLPGGAACPECGHAVGERVPLVVMLWPPTVIAGSLLFLIATSGAATALLTHRWMAIDRLPPLHHAAAMGDVRTIERLLAAGEDPDAFAALPNFLAPWLDEPTPLILAVEGGHSEAVRLLLDAGATAADQRRSLHAVHAALIGDDDTIAGMVLEALPSGPPLTEVCDMLPFASDEMRTLAIERFDWEPWRLGYAADQALGARDMAWFERLMAEGIDPEATTSGGFLSAAVHADVWGRAGHTIPDAEPTRRLLELGFDRAPMAVPNAVETAVVWGNTPALDLFIERDPMLARTLRWLPADALLEPVAEGRAPMVARLAELGVALDAPTLGGERALHVAAIYLRVGVVRALLDRGADPTLLADGMTARERLVAREDMRALPEARRILDLLEAAEAEWNAREPDPAPPGHP